MKSNIKIKFFGLIAAAVWLAFPAFVSAGKLDSPYKLRYPALKFNPPVTKRLVLKNGMTLHLLENHELPIVDISSMVRIGSAYEPAEKAGLASLTGGVWRSGGTTTVPPGELDEKLEFIGASLETSIGREAGSISLSTLTKDLDEGLRLFADLILNPAFDEKRFDVAKERMIEGIKREDDDPTTIARREFKRLLLGDHPFGHVPTLKTLGRISRDDCEKFYKDHIGPRNFIIGISGDFYTAEIVGKLEKLFWDMKPAKQQLPEIPPLPEKINAGVYIMDKKLPQTVFRSGHFGISRRNPDYYAVRVMNFIMGGGGFSSRMLKDIRSKRGLAYSVWSYFVGGENLRGRFVTGGETKAESSYEFMLATRDIIWRMVEHGVSEMELTLAKESIINSFVFGFDKDTKIVSKYLWLEYYGLPMDYLETFRDNIRKVTRADAKRAAAEYLHPDEMIILAVGDNSVMGKDLARLGPVKYIEPAK
ncbi:MAG: peptidase M16 [bacterium]|nr:MAG: peptidase M16 [bacterium]